MNITQESVTDFVVGHGGADAAGRPIVAAGYVKKAYKGVRVRAATANTIVDLRGATEASVRVTGYPLPAGEELDIPIEDPSEGLRRRHSRLQLSADSGPGGSDRW